jgi:hypothetical protein
MNMNEVLRSPDMSRSFVQSLGSQHSSEFDIDFISFLTRPLLQTLFCSFLVPEKPAKVRRKNNGNWENEKEIKLMKIAFITNVFVIHQSPLEAGN